MSNNCIPQIGKCSWFGGANDTGVGINEGLALCTLRQALGPYAHLFIQPLNRRLGLARQLSPTALYCAMRWDYEVTTPSELATAVVRVSFNGCPFVEVKPIDWGPNVDTGRIIDLSPRAMQLLGCKTDDEVDVQIIC